MEEWREKSNSEEKTRLVEQHYKYTTLTNDFVHKVLNDKVNIDAFSTTWLLLHGWYGPEDYTLILIYNKNVYRLLNDFEISDKLGNVNIKATKAWQKGMFKTLPEKSENGIDREHYLKDLRKFEHSKVDSHIDKLLASSDEEENDF